MQPGNRIDSFCNSGADHKCVHHTRANVRELDVELFPIRVKKTARNGGVYAVEGDDSVRREEPVEHEADDSAYRVFGQQIQRIVDADVEFHWSAEGGMSANG